MWPEIALILGAYLLGSFPHLYLLGRASGVDLRKEDMHIALWRKVGRLQGTVGVLGELAKGVLPVVVARAVGFDLLWVALAGLAAVVGQMWPIFLGFDGEKGNSIGLAMALALAYKATLLMLVPIFIGFAWRTVPRMLNPSLPWSERLKFGGPPSRSLPLAMASAFALLPLLSWGLGEALEVNLAFLGLFLLIMVRRLTTGLRKDLRQAQNKKMVLLNRLLYDRSFL